MVALRMDSFHSQPQLGHCQDLLPAGPPYVSVLLLALLMPSWHNRMLAFLALMESLVLLFKYLVARRGLI